MAFSAFQRRQLTYSGHVQGVGFRYRTQTIAREYKVTGYVRNLADGRVELLVEGAAQELDSFLGELSEQLSEQIRSVDISPDINQTPGSNRFADFEIRY